MKSKITKVVIASGDSAKALAFLREISARKAELKNKVANLKSVKNLITKQ